MHFMMIKEDMKSLVISFIFLALTFTSSSARGLKDISHMMDEIQHAEASGDYKTASELCFEIAEMHNTKTSDFERYKRYFAKAYFNLGHYYLHSHYVPYDIKLAISNFEKAAELKHEHARAELYLAMIYNLKKYGVQDYEKSFYWMQQGAERCTTMRYLLAEIYEKGKTVFLNRDTVRVDRSGRKVWSFNVMLRSKTVLSFPNVTVNKQLAYENYLIYFKGSCYVKPLVFSKYEIGVAFMDGTFFERDFSEAQSYLLSFAPSLAELSTDYKQYQNEKVADALWRLSVLYRFGLGVMENGHKADLYTKYAALCGNKKAQRFDSNYE